MHGKAAPKLMKRFVAKQVPIPVFAGRVRVSISVEITCRSSAEIPWAVPKK
jgi:hypothetical protein